MNTTLLIKLSSVKIKVRESPIRATSRWLFLLLLLLFALFYLSLQTKLWGNSFFRPSEYSKKDHRRGSSNHEGKEQGRKAEELGGPNVCRVVGHGQRGQRSARRQGGKREAWEESREQKVRTRPDP